MKKVAESISLMGVQEVFILKGDRIDLYEDVYINLSRLPQFYMHLNDRFPLILGKKVFCYEDIFVACFLARDCIFSSPSDK